MLSFKEFISEEIANTVANVAGMQTEPVITQRRQVKFVRRKPITKEN